MYLFSLCGLRICEKHKPISRFFFSFTLYPPLKYDQSCPPEKKRLQKTKIENVFKELFDEFF